MAKNVTPSNQQRKWTDLLTPRNIIAGVIVIVALLFIFQNTATGEFHFLFLDMEAPTWLWLLGVFAAGFVGGFLFSRYRTHSKAGG